MANLVEQEASPAFGRYQVLGVLGDGTMGRLYLAENRGGDGGPAIVAVRGIHRELSAGPGFERALTDAVRVASALRHPNLAATYELGEFDGGQFLTMEYLPGESLAAILARCAAPTPMPPAIAAALVHQCAEALRYAHEVRDVHGTQIQVVHRDIRPENIFVTYQGTVKVVGTGAGLLRAQVVALGDVPVPPNSLAYTAPEGITAGPPDVRVDVFSMGVVLWECLTGRSLFHADGAAKVREAVRSRYVEPPSVFNPEVVPGLDEVALRSLSRDPRRRYQSAKEMALAIDTAILALGRRPTSAAMAEWLEGLFGAERASLKTQIARGGGVPGALGRLRLLGGDAVPARARRTDPLGAEVQPLGEPLPPANPSRLGLRPLVPAAPPARAQGVAPRLTDTATWTGGPPVPRADVPLQGEVAEVDVQSLQTIKAARPIIVTPLPGSLPAPAVVVTRSRGLGVPWLIALGVVAAAVVVGAALAIRGGGAGPTASQQPAAAPIGVIEVSSTPPGGQVLIDGDPSGLSTPARISGLRAGRKVEVRVDKAGYRSEKQTTDVPSTGSRTLSFRLVESVGEVRLEGIPPHAATYLDDQPIDGSHPLSLPVGSHRLRVEVAGQLFSTMKLEVRPGGQNVLVRPTEGNGR